MEKEEALKNILIPRTGDTVYYGDASSGVGYELGMPINADKGGQESSSGGEGTVYRASGGQAFKIYKKEHLNAQTIDKITAMVNKKPNLSDNICWPQQLLFESSKLRIPVGFSMKNIKSELEEIPTLDKLISAKEYFVKQWGWTRLSFVRVCIKIAETFLQLHKNGILMGDVNTKNILVGKNCNVFFIDVDSYQFDEFLCPVGTPEFASPRIHSLGGQYGVIKRTEDDERFAIAMLIYRILFFNAMPFYPNDFDVKNAIINHHFRFEDDNCTAGDVLIWKNLTPDLRKTFSDAFLKGKYVDESVWISQLNDLYTCIDAGYLSNELSPTAAIENEQFKIKKFKKVACVRCGASIELPQDAAEKAELCSSCKEIKKNNNRRIFRVNCKKCKKAFTLNPWDSGEIDTDDCLCPDCDENSTLTFNLEEDNLKKVFAFAMENLKPEQEEDII